MCSEDMKLPDRVVFLDIDGVLQPGGRQNRFKHMKDGSYERIIQIGKDNYPFVDSSYDPIFESSLFPYDVLAVAYDWEAEAVDFVKKLLEQNDAKIVLSSSWRDKGFRAMRFLLAMHGLDRYLADATPVHHREYIKDGIDLMFDEDYQGKERNVRKAIDAKLKEELQPDHYINERVSEIYAYLIKHPEIRSYVVLDDIWFGSLFGEHAIHTRYRLNAECFEKADRVLNTAYDRKLVDVLANCVPQEDLDGLYKRGEEEFYK